MKVKDFKEVLSSFDDEQEVRCFVFKLDGSDPDEMDIEGIDETNDEPILTINPFYPLPTE